MSAVIKPGDPRMAGVRSIGELADSARPTPAVSRHVATVEQAFIEASQIVADPRTAVFARDALDAGVTYEVVIHVKPMPGGVGYNMDVCRYERRPKIQIAHWGHIL